MSKQLGKCEDSDPNCPVCGGRCDQDATMILYRVDMEDSSGTALCEGCAEDALESGVFTVYSEDDPPLSWFDSE